MHEHLDVMMQHLNQDQGIMNESFPSQASKQSESQQSKPSSSVIQINRSMRTASRKVILAEHGGAAEDQNELRAENDSRESLK